MLYSLRSSVWKIVDFGLTSKGTTTGPVATEQGRGTTGYRAPELLSESNLSFNKMVDIWSLGCILYELCVGKKAFENDWATHEFSLQRELKTVSIPNFNGHICHRLEQLISETLHHTPQSRPSAISLKDRFSEVSQHLKDTIQKVFDKFSILHQLPEANVG